MKPRWASPPLHISFAGTYHTHYDSFESKPPARGTYVPPSDMTPFPLRFRGTQLHSPVLYPIGVLSFACRRNLESSFFILWGVQLSQLEISEPSSTLGRSWWDEAEPACAVLSWGDVEDGEPNMSGEGHLEGWGTSYLLQRYASRGVYERMVARGWPSPNQELVTAENI